MPLDIVKSFCGNGVLDPEEDCDVGHVLQNHNVCCTSNCRFQEGAVCSPYNHPCCTETCQVAPETQKCYLIYIYECYDTPFCSGTDSRMCPQSRSLPNNSSCGDQGKCWHGNCVPFCQVLGQRLDPPRRLEACTSDTDRTIMCKHSCWEPGQGEVCRVMGGAKKDGTPCLFGYCHKGECIEPADINDEFPLKNADEHSRTNHSSRLYGLNFLLSISCVLAFFTLLAVL